MEKERGWKIVKEEYRKEDKLHKGSKEKKILSHAKIIEVNKIQLKNEKKFFIIKMFFLKKKTNNK